MAQLNNGRFVKGHNPWNKGLKGTHFSPATEFRKGGPVNEKHPGWKGDKASYAAIHVWIARHFTRPLECEHCSTKIAKKFEWANISKKYLRDRSDWLNLCTSCHQDYDGHGTRNMCGKHAS